MCQEPWQLSRVPEGGTPPAPTTMHPSAGSVLGPGFLKFVSDPFILYSLFYKILLQVSTPRDSLLGASHFFAKLTTRMSDSDARRKAENPGVDKLCWESLHTCTSSHTLFLAGDSASHTFPRNQSDAYSSVP